MNLPRTLKIGAYVYEIEEIPTAEAWARNKHGESSRILRKVRVNTSLNDVEAADTTLHEILHCLFDQYMIEQGDNEERMVCTLGGALTATIADNPVIFHAILEALAPSFPEDEPETFDASGHAPLRCIGADAVEILRNSDGDITGFRMCADGKVFEPMDTVTGALEPGQPMRSREHLVAGIKEENIAS